MQETQKNFALQVGAFITLYISITAFLTLVFGLINIILPDAADEYWRIQNNQEAMRVALAGLIVFFPTYLLLTRLVNKARRSTDSLYHTLTKWVVYLSLLVGGLVMLGDLVIVVITYLNGEISSRFLLKAVVLFVTIGSAFWYYSLDAKGHWNKNEKGSVTVGAVALIFAIAVVVLSFYYIDSPKTVREVRLDQQQISDLQDMQWRIEAYYQRENSLPNSITAAYEDIEIPSDQQDREPYAYRVTGTQSYELCATFVQMSPENELRSIAKPVTEPGYDPNNYIWEHGVGEKCFPRTVSSVN